jgi:hypothetical protein
MVGPLIIIGSNGSMWSHTRVLERARSDIRIAATGSDSTHAPAASTCPMR